MIREVGRRLCKLPVQTVLAVVLGVLGVMLKNSLINHPQVQNGKVAARPFGRRGDHAN